MVVSKISTSDSEYKFSESFNGDTSQHTQDATKAQKNFRDPNANTSDIVDVVFTDVPEGKHYVYIKVSNYSNAVVSSKRFIFKCSEIGSIWESAIPSRYGEDYPYLWNYTETVFSEGDPSTTEPQVIAHWGKVGSDGKGISAIEEYYCITQTEDAPGIDDFGDANEVKYPTIYYPFLWNYEIVRYTDGSATENPTIKLVGVYGQNGDDGAGIASVTNWYYTCNEADGITNDPSFGWEQTITPVSVDKKYLWNYEEIAYTDGRENSKTPACIIGNFAEDGKDGDGITDVIEYYATSTKPGVAPSDDDYSPTVPALDATNKYLWNKELIKTTSNPNGSFTTACVIGVYGEDGKTYYTWIKYADDADGTNMDDSPNGKKYMGIAVNKLVPEESATTTDGVHNPSTYKWVKIIGDSAIAYSMVLSTHVIRKDNQNNLAPSSITLTAKSQVGTGTPEKCYCYFKVEKSTDENLSSWDSGTKLGRYQETSFSNYDSTIKGLRFSMYLDSNYTNLLDQQTVPVISDGTDGDGKDAYTVVISNENHTFVGDDTKVLGTQTTTCDVIAYKGATQQAVTLGTATLPAGATGITVTPSGSGTTNAKLTISVDSTLSPLSGSISIPITIDSNKSFTKTFSYSVALKGDKGDPGKGISTIEEYYFASDNLTAPPTSVQVAPFNYSMSVAEVSKTNTSIGYSLDADGYYDIDMNATNSAYILIKLTFTVTKATDIILKCINYAETNWDYMLVSKISTSYSDYKFGAGSVSTDDQRFAEKDFKTLHSADPVDVEYKNVSVGTHYVYIKVYKDGSTTKDYETFKFKAVEKSEWPTTIPSDYGSDKPYLWNYTKTNYTDGNSESSAPAIISYYGGKGEDGVGISSIEEYYCTTASNSPPATTSFTKHTPGTAVPKPDATKQYLWNYEKIIYTKGDPAVTDVRLVCVFGKNGDNGRGVDSVKTQYYLSTSNSSQIGGSWQDTMPTWQAGRYLWKREVVYYTDAPTTPVTGTAIIDTSWDKLGTIDSVVNAAEASLSETLLLGNGMTKTTLANGSIYYHTNSVLQNSVAGDIICVLNANGFGVCRSGWNNGNPSFSYGSTFAGEALWDTVTARKISADMIEAGTIEALSTAKLHSSWSLNDGKIVFLGEDERVVGSIHAELTRIVDGAEYPLGGVGLTIEDLNNDTITQIANGVIRLGDPDGILEPVMWLAAEKLKQYLDKTYVIDMTKAPNNHETIITKDEIQTKKIRCEDVELFLYSQEPNKSISLYGAFEKWVNLLDSHKLYPLSGDESASNTTITLSKSANNYEYIEIYFRDNYTRDCGCVKVYNPNNKDVLLNTSRYENGAIYTYNTEVKITDDTITPNADRSGLHSTSSAGYASWSGNFLYITRVVGVKPISS